MFIKIGKLTLRSNTGKQHHYEDAGPVFKLQWGSGAGYIGGFTAYVARNSKSMQHSKSFGGRANFRSRYSAFTRSTGIEIGCTRNANRVPY